HCAEMVRHDSAITAFVGQLHIRERERVIRCTQQFVAIELPLISERSESARRDAQRYIRARKSGERLRLLRYDDGTAQDSGPGSERESRLRINECDRVFSGVRRSHV